jgi:L-asparaginase
MRKSKNVLEKNGHFLIKNLFGSSSNSILIIRTFCYQFLSFAAMIQVFVTGGTFDKEYNYITGELYFKDTHLSEMFQLGRCGLDIDIRTLMMVDSLEMREEDRALIIHSCARNPSNHILITHGTDRMVETARHLAEADIEGKTIVLTGAMIPYAFGNSSDGFFNLGSALAFVQILPPGVYVVMNGRYFDWNRVRKNRQTGTFEALLEDESGLEYSI